LLKDVELLYANGGKPENLVESATSIEEAAVYYDDFTDASKWTLGASGSASIDGGQLLLNNTSGPNYETFCRCNIALEPSTHYVLSFSGSKVEVEDPIPEGVVGHLIVYDGFYNWANTQITDAWLGLNDK
jgi:hypothetical protein